jgi:hypothetical protein
MKTIVTLALAVTMFAATLVFVTPAQAEEPLGPYMNDLQRYSHKLGLSIDAGNQPLAEFYSSKLTEAMGLIETKFPTWQKLQIGALMKAMLGAPLTPLGAAIGKGDMAGASSAYDALLANGCNGCHVATQRPFIKVTRVKSNPYNQSFSK